MNTDEKERDLIGSFPLENPNTVTLYNTASLKSK